MRQRLSRRRLLALLGAGLANRLLGGSGALAGGTAGNGSAPDERGDIRVGVVLPVRSGGVQVDPFSQALAGEAARRGAEMAGEDFGSFELQQRRKLEILVSSAPDEEAARRAAHRLVAIDEAIALIGGFGEAQARALSQVAEETNTLFVNIGSASEALRTNSPSRTFHVEANASAYLDALIGAYEKQRVRSWFILYDSDAEGAQLYRTSQVALSRRDRPMVEAGAFAVTDSSAHPAAFDAIRQSGAEAVLMLLNWRAQLDFLGHYEAEGHQKPITGFPFPETQTRDYLASVVRAAPRSAAHVRISLWEASGESVAGASLGQEFLARWGHPMDPHAWAAYVAVGLIVEAALQAHELCPLDLAHHLKAQARTSDLYKSGKSRFHTDDHQLQQALYLIALEPTASGPFDVISGVEELAAGSE